MSKLNVELKLNNIGTSYIKGEYLNEFIKKIQDAGMLAIVTYDDEISPDLEDICDDEDYNVYLYMLNTEK